MKKPKISLTNADKVRDKITEKQITEIREMFSRMADEIAKKAKSFEGKTNISSIIQKKYFEDLEKELKKQMDADFKNLEKVIKADMQVASESVISCVRDFEEKIGMPVSNAWLNVPVDAVTAVASGSLYDNNWSLSKRIWGTKQKVLKDIHEVVATGIAENKSAYDIAKDLEKYVDPRAKKDWEWSKVYPNTNRKVDYSAQRLARTMVSHAYQFSFEKSTKDNPFITKYKWVSSHDKRVCPICKKRDGKLYDKDKLPLDHPNGRCTFVSVFDKNMNEIGDDLAAWVKGKEGDYPELDKYMKKRYGEKKYSEAMKKAYAGDKKKVKKTKVAEFTAQQKKFFSKYGYTTDKIPTLDEYILKASSKDILTLSDVASKKGMTYAEYYNKYLAKVKYKHKEIEEIEKQAEKIKEYLFDKEKWKSIRSKQTVDYMRKFEEEWEKKLSSAEKRAVHLYTQENGHNDYRVQNGHLRFKKKVNEVVKNTISDIRSALDKSILEEDTILARGTKKTLYTDIFKGNLKALFDSENYKDMVGEMFEDPGFLSTSPLGGEFGGDLKFIIYAPKGTKAGYVENNNAFGEKEMIVQAGTRYFIEDIEKNDRSVTMYLSIVSQ